MDITKAIQKMKKKPGFTEHVGMILVHNGTVRAWSRKDRSSVGSIDVTVNRKKIQSLQFYYLKA